MRKLIDGGVFITFEGTEGAGKSTLMREVAFLLEDQGFRTLKTREPGGSPLAEQIRHLILGNPMGPKTELLLYEAARADHLENIIQPALAQGRIVLCDRFTDSTLAYQGFARGIAWDEVRTLNQFATSNLTPHLTAFLDLPPEIGLARVQDPNRFENEGTAFQEKVRAGFYQARSENPDRWISLDSWKHSPSENAEILFKEIQVRFKDRIQ